MQNIKTVTTLINVFRHSLTTVSLKIRAKCSLAACGKSQTEIVVKKCKMEKMDIDLYVVLLTK